jgi:hypothetical protein
MDFALRLERWENDDVDDPALFRDFVGLSQGPSRATLWSRLNQVHLLDVIKFEGFQKAPRSEIRSILDGVRQFVHMDALAQWRALRLLVGDVPRDVWEDYWEDVISDDALRHARANSVLLPALERSDAVYVERVLELCHDRSISDEARIRLRNILDRSKRIDPEWN